MGSLKFDLAGMVFGKLTVIRRVRNGKNCSVRWESVCECGGKTISDSFALRIGKSKSCGCIQREIAKKMKTTHDRFGTAEYSSWQHMKDRCLNKKNDAYKYYGERGITVCDSWIVFENFYKDMGKCPNKMTLERIDNFDSYFKQNCKWATRKEQSNNTRRNHLLELNGVTMNIKQWSEVIGINYKTLLGRINDSGWSIERALTTPLLKQSSRE